MSRSPEIDECLERLCRKGCARVWHDIDALEQGQALPETAGLDADQRAVLLAELKAVMSVYRARCSVEPGR